MRRFVPPHVSRNTHFAPQSAEKSDNESVNSLRTLLENHRKVLRVQLCFVTSVLQPLYKAIKSLQQALPSTVDVLTEYMTYVCLSPPGIALFFIL